MFGGRISMYANTFGVYLSSLQLNCMEKTKIAPAKSLISICFERNIVAFFHNFYRFILNHCTQMIADLCQINYKVASMPWQMWYLYWVFRTFFIYFIVLLQILHIFVATDTAFAVVTKSTINFISQQSIFTVHYGLISITLHYITYHSHSYAQWSSSVSNIIMDEDLKPFHFLFNFIENF